MVKPRDFDPAKRYPVLLTQYSGPGSQQVLDRWSLDWEDALVDAGYIVACTDGRGTGCRGEAFRKRTYGRLGALEVEDQLSFAAIWEGLHTSTRHASASTAGPTADSWRWAAH